MCDKQRNISLGFTDESFKEGIHVCQIFDDDDERAAALEAFLLSGLQDGEKTSCFSEKVDMDQLKTFFNKNNVSLDDATQKGDFSLSGTRNVYFKNNKFEPEKMLALLEDYYETAKSEGYPGSRVIGEMTSEVQDMEGGSRLMEYEAKVSLLVEKHPLTAVCQYDAKSFDGATILDILKVHPYMVLHGKVIRNPFFIQPREVLKDLNC